MYNFIKDGFTLSPLNRRILSLSWPVVVGMISYTVVWMTDMAMVGVLGKQAQGAVSVGGTVFNLFLSAMMGAGIGIQLLVARRIGEKREGTAGRVLLTATTMALSLGLVVTALCWTQGALLLQPFAQADQDLELLSSYLAWRAIGFIFYFAIFILRGFFDGIGLTTPGMYSSFITMTMNVFLNWVLIFGNLGAPALGLDGAGIASSLAALPGMLIYFFFFSPKLKSYFAGFSARDFLRMPVIREVTRIGFPTAAENSTMTAAFLVFYYFAGLVDRANAAALGPEYANVAVAASGIIVAVLSLSFLPGVAFGIAATTILGQAMGAGKFNLARLAVYRAAFYSGLIMGCFGLLFLVFARPIISIFNTNELVIAEAYWPLILVAIVQIPDAYNMVMTAAVRSAGLVYWVLARIIVIAWGMFLPAAYFFGIVLGLGTVGLWLGIIVWICTTCVVFTKKFVSGDWKTVKI